VTTLWTTKNISSDGRNCKYSPGILPRFQIFLATYHHDRTKQVAKPYFREWSNLKYNEGKTFKSNPRIFKQEKSLFFPNLYGTTLASPSKPKDTTHVLKGKISVVNLFSSLWAEQQVATFTNQKQNPELHKVLAAEPSVAQRVDINLEENSMRAWLVRLFMGNLRRKLPVEQHNKYFLVQKGMTETIKLSIGMLNTKVGYVYLVDEFGHIRWAGSGSAELGEKESLNAGLLRLIDERKRRITGEGQASSAPSRPRVVPTPRQS
jgi:mitochondrial ATPase complex subunit ATP10